VEGGGGLYPPPRIEIERKEGLMEWKSRGERVEGRILLPGSKSKE